MAFFIHAPNIHQGGGGGLLSALIKEFSEYPDARINVDERFVIPDGTGNSIHISRVPSTVFGRLKAERDLRRKTGPGDIVLCFGSLPPLFKLRAKVFVFMQNRYLVENFPLKEFPIRVRFRLAVERLWLSWRSGGVDKFIVQTPTMRQAVENSIGITPMILPFSEFPFSVNGTQGSSRINQSAKYEFLYVASGEPHKNHKRLIEAWISLAIENLRPSLCLTIAEEAHPGLWDWIKKNKEKYKLRIENVGEGERDEIHDLYKNSGAFIFPSTFESFGIPLVEARSANLCILASELDFVRDILDPDLSFDPFSPVSIARAVKRFLGKDEKPMTIMDAAGFLRIVFREALAQ